MRLVLVLVSFIYSSIAIGSTYVAIGDSITSGLNSAWFAPIGKFSFATGWGLERNLASYLNADSVYNVALPGAISGYIQYQADFAHHVQADYVSLTIGANDVCWGLSGDVLSNVRRLSRQLLAYTHTKKVLVSSIPDLRQVYNVRRNTPSCQLPKLFCHGYFIGDEAYRQKVDNDILATNRNLEKLTKELPNLVYVNISADTYGQQDISDVDCFHPSPVGQQRIADAFIKAAIAHGKTGSEE